MPLNKNRLEIGKNLAVHALKSYYSADWEQQKRLYSLCLNNLSNANIVKIFLKLQREQLNQIIVRSVLNDLPAEKKKFIELKYKKNLSLIKIQIELNVSKGQLCIWNAEILEVIEDMMFYRLPSRDIYNAKKILTLLYILEQQIVYLEENCNDIVDKDHIKFLKEKQEKYFKIYRYLSNYLESEEYTMPIKIIKARSELGVVPLSVLAEKAECSVARVSEIMSNYNKMIDRL